MKYRKLDADGDYQFGNGAEFLKDTPLAVAQAIYTRLLLHTNEWFLDSTEGTPYAEQIEGFGTQATRDPAVQSRIIGTPGVQELLSYNSALSKEREFTVNARVDTLFGQVQAAFAMPTGGSSPPPPPPPPPPSIFSTSVLYPFIVNDRLQVPTPSITLGSLVSMTIDGLLVPTAPSIEAASLTETINFISYTNGEAFPDGLLVSAVPPIQAASLDVTINFINYTNGENFPDGLLVSAVPPIQAASLNVTINFVNYTNGENFPDGLTTSIPTIQSASLTP